MGAEEELKEYKLLLSKVRKRRRIFQWAIIFVAMLALIYGLTQRIEIGKKSDIANHQIELLKGQLVQCESERK